MTADDRLDLATEESLTVEVEQPTATEKVGFCKWLRSILNLDDASNQKHHYPMFIIIMCILHILVHLMTYIELTWRGQPFAMSLFHLLRLFVPCMRPTSEDIRSRSISCKISMPNTTCFYDDELKKMCFSFLYPNQLWRMVTVNLLHLNYLHLLANLSKQLLYGIALEHKYGSIRVFIVYWLSDIGASLSFMLKNIRGCK